MPTIINTYAATPGNSIGKSLEDLGNSIWGPQAASAEYAKQKARAASRENYYQEDLINRARRGQLDMKSPEVQAGIVGLENPERFFQGQRGIAATVHGADSPQAGDAYVAAGGAYSGTAAAHHETEANQARIQDMISKRQMAVKQYELDNTPVQVFDPVSKRTVLVPRSQFAGREAPPTPESVKGAVLQGYLQGQPPQGGQPSAPPAQPNAQPSAFNTGAAPVAAGNPFSGMSPQMQHVLGVGMTEQAYVHPQSGLTGTSRDGGQTITLTDGRTVPGMGTGFMPVPADAALAQARDNNVRASASQPLVVGDPTQGQAAADARATSGIAPTASRILNEEIGAIPGATSVLNAVAGSPEVGADTRRAESRQDIRNNQARSVLLSSPGRQTVQAQKWVNELLPQGSIMANPETEANRVKTIVDALAADHEQIRQLATDPNTLPTERPKLVQQLHTIENTIRMFTEPPEGAAQQPAQPAAPAPQQPAPAQVSQQSFDVISEARKAIAQGAPKAAIIQELQSRNIQIPPDL
jgi:hypothetical protein